MIGHPVVTSDHRGYKALNIAYCLSSNVYVWLTTNFKVNEICFSYSGLWLWLGGDQLYIHGVNHSGKCNHGASSVLNWLMADGHERRSVHHLNQNAFACKVYTI